MGVPLYQLYQRVFSDDDVIDAKEGGSPLEYLKLWQLLSSINIAIHNQHKLEYVLAC